MVVVVEVAEVAEVVVEVAEVVVVVAEVAVGQIYFLPPVGQINLLRVAEVVVVWN